MTAVQVAAVAGAVLAVTVAAAMAALNHHDRKVCRWPNQTDKEV